MLTLAVLSSNKFPVAHAASIPLDEVGLEERAAEALEVNILFSIRSKNCIIPHVCDTSRVAINIFGA
jgi:hypothetical protein